MANNIALAKNYIPLLDEVYKLASLTAVLESPAELARAGASAREILLPKMDLVGLGDYNRSTGYAVGDVTLSYQTHTFNFERGRKFSLDAMDNEETQGVLVGRLLGEYVRTKVVPELDAFRFAKFAAEANAANTTFGGFVSGNLTNGVQTLSAIRAGITKLDNNEVPPEGRFLFITPALLGQIEDLKTDESRAVLAGLTVVKVPQTRFFTAITQNAGATAGAGGYIKAVGADDINFMLVSNTAPVVFTKHLVSDILSPDVNPDADAFVLKYRSYGLAEVLENKIGGIYVNRFVA
jgi:hypothetical protein